MPAVAELSQEQFRQQILTLARQPGVFGTKDPSTGEDCTREGLVVRNTDEYPVSEFAHNVFKYVRKGHVKTDEHWTRHWKRARLFWEFNENKEKYDLDLSSTYKCNFLGADNKQ